MAILRFVVTGFAGRLLLGRPAGRRRARLLGAYFGLVVFLLFTTAMSPLRQGAARLPERVGRGSDRPGRPNRVHHHRMRPPGGVPGPSACPRSCRSCSPRPWARSSVDILGCDRRIDLNGLEPAQLDGLTDMDPPDFRPRPMPSRT
ncbi:MAG: hypothetical protein WKF78_14380 [Candidatus Limnocylindrales bacterium]